MTLESPTLKSHCTCDLAAHPGLCPPQEFLLIQGFLVSPDGLLGIEGSGVLADSRLSVKIEESVFYMSRERDNKAARLALQCKHQRMFLYTLQVLTCLHSSDCSL